MPGFSVTTNFNGDLVEEIMVLASVQNETVAGGHINIETDIRKDRSLPRMQMSQIIQDRAATPVSSGLFTYDERKLTPKDWMVYVEFNPNDFRAIWQTFQSTDPFVFSELPNDVQIVMVRLVLEGQNGVNPYIGQAIWQGDIAAGTPPLDKFDGLRVKAAADATVVDVVGTTLTAANIFAELQKVYDASRVEARRHPDYKIFIPDSAFELYTNALRDLTNKSIDPTEEAPKLFRGKTLVNLVGMPDDTMTATVSNDDRSSNIHLGVGAIEDQNTLQIEKLQANSEKWFIKMLMDMDTQIMFGEDYVDYR